MNTLNLGILAHVDAGKTSLTERLLYAAGVIDEVGSVDDGSTQTDTLALERQRGITIKSAVVSFAVGDVTVNLIDTPGHPDFIAEVERVLSVLDGAVLVVSAVEGVQAQTRVLLRTLRRLGIPTLLFVNKIDRAGARDDRHRCAAIAGKLTPAVVAMGSVQRARHPRRRVHALRPGRRRVHGQAGRAARRPRRRRCWPRPSTTRPRCPTAGSAAPWPTRSGGAWCTRCSSARPSPGPGWRTLTAAIAELLPAAGGDPDGPCSGTVFKVERGPAGEKIAYVRMFSGTLRVRDRVRFGDGNRGARSPRSPCSTGAPSARRASVAAGRIGQLWGLGDVQDRRRHRRVAGHLGAALVRPADPGDGRPPPPAGRQGRPAHRPDPARRAGPADQPAPGRHPPGAVRVALRRGAEGGHPGDAGRRLRPRGRVPRDHHHLHRAAASAAARRSSSSARSRTRSWPPSGCGSTRRRPAAAWPSGWRSSSGRCRFAFFKAVEETVHETLGQGLHGWQVTDCTVTMTHSGYWARQSHAHATFDKSMSSTAGDFRNLTPLVLMAALARAGTRVHEPMHRFRLELPADTLGRGPARAGAAAGGPADHHRPGVVVRAGRRGARRPGSTSWSSSYRGRRAARACWRAPSTATSRSGARPRPAPGPTTTRSTARSTCWRVLRRVGG